MKIIKAARGRITGHFGDTGVPGAHVPAHLGTDIGHGDQTAEDLRVSAPAAGRITFAGRLGTYGNCLKIDHGDEWSSVLAHLAAIATTSGTVEAGQHVGTMGSTGGDWPVHLHQELRYRGVPIDAELHFGDLADVTTTPITNPQGEDEMKPYIINDGGAYYLCVPGRKMIHIDGPEALAAIRKMLAGGSDFTLKQVQAIERHWVQIPA